MNLTLYRWRTSLAAVALTVCAVAMSGCSEKLESTGGCPIACSGETSDIQNVTLDAVTLDTTANGSFGLGSELFMLLAARGDTVDSRVIVRFDSLPRRVRVSSTDTTTNPITDVDSVYFRFRLDSGALNLDVPATISVYDVSTTGNDTAVATLAPLFEEPGRLLATKTFDPGTLVDTISIELPRTFVLGAIQSNGPVRLGVRVSASKSVSAQMYASETNFTPHLNMRISPDQSIAVAYVAPKSFTPAANPAMQFNLADFPLLVKAPPAPPAGALVVGGLPGKRTYLRFDIPRKYLDSSIVVRASLLLTQIPGTGPDAADTIRVVPLLGVGSANVTDISYAVQLTSVSLTPMDTLKTVPQNADQVSIEIAPAFRAWRAQADSVLPRAIILQHVHEDASPQSVLFYSTEALDPAVRPKLRISFTPRTRIATP